MKTVESRKKFKLHTHSLQSPLQGLGKINNLGRFAPSDINFSSPCKVRLYKLCVNSYNESFVFPVLEAGSLGQRLEEVLATFCKLLVRAITPRAKNFLKDFAKKVH